MSAMNARTSAVFLAALSAAEAGCGEKAPTERHIAVPTSVRGTSSVDDSLEPAIAGPATTFRVTRSADLEGPVQHAFSAFASAHQGEPATFLVELPAGELEGGRASLSLQRPDDSQIAVVVACNEDAPARLSSDGIYIAASAVTLRNIVFDGLLTNDALLYVDFRTRVTLDRVAFINGLVWNRDAEESMIFLHGTGNEPRSVVVKDSWFVGNRSRWGSEAVLRLPLGAGTAAATIRMMNVVLAGNQAKCGIAPGSADAQLRNVVFYEPSITDALICLADPRHVLAIEGGTLAAGPKVIDYQVGKHLQRGDYKSATMSRTIVRLSAPLASDEAIQRNVQYEPARVPPSLDVVTEAARRGGAPHPTELGL